MCLTIEQWGILISTVVILFVAFVGWIIEWARASRNMDKFPHFKIRYSRGMRIETGTSHHHLELENLICYENPSSKRIFYATPTTNGWRELPVKSGTIKGNRKESRVGDWFPYHILKDDKYEKSVQKVFVSAMGQCVIPPE